jgi:hypothetical protein
MKTRTSHGGTFGNLSLKRAVNFLKAMSGGDATIAALPRGGYEVRDAYRPGMTWTGKTPREACRLANFFPPACCFQYDK